MEERKSKNAIIVGLFVIIAITILIVAVFKLGGEQKTFSSKFPLKVVLTDISGLKEGNNVWFSGVKIGTVRNIELKGFKNVEVSMMIEESARKFIHKDATAKIGSEGWIGNKLINIYEGSGKMQPVDDNDYIKMQTISDDDDLTAILTSGSKNLLEITKNFKAISAKIADGQGTVGKLINDPEMASNLQLTMDNLKVLSENSKHAVENIENFTNRMNNESNAINQLMDDKTLYDSIRVAVNQIKATAEKANEFATNINAFADKLNSAGNDTNSVAGKLLSDKEMAAYIENTLKNLETASVLLNQDLEAMKHNFLTKKYFKDQEKEKKKAEKNAQ